MLQCVSSSCPHLQVATDTRLWLYGALQDTRGYLADLIKTAITRAELDVDVVMPGFTHLQVPISKAPHNPKSLESPLSVLDKHRPVVMPACTAPCSP